MSNEEFKQFLDGMIEAFRIEGSIEKEKLVEYIRDKFRDVKHY